jgi:hypothetical protein
VNVFFRILNGVMAALFAFAVLVQYNDPDPIRWIMVYGAACVTAAVRAVRGTVPFALVVTVGAIALVWAAAIAIGGPGLSVYGYMFGAWEMKSTSVEEAREASGLLIVGFWMGVLMISEWRSRS